jgi:hypothetical protein
MSGLVLSGVLYCFLAAGQEAASTDPGKMSRAELQQAVARLVTQAERYELQERPGREPEATAYRIYHLLYYRIMGAGSPHRSTWTKEDLHAAMVPLFLEMAGYKDNPPEKPDKAGRIPYAAIRMLATLRTNGDAPGLDKIADDARQTSATRLTCALAVSVAGEALKTPVLLGVLEKEKDLELRLVAILALRYSREKRMVGEKLISWLDDPNGEIRTAAICALRGPLPPQALPKLKKAIDDLDPPQAMVFVFDVIGEYKSRAACEMLAGYLSAAFEDREKRQHILPALSGFNKASGQRFMRAGAHNEEYYLDQAKAAVKWWNDVGRRTFKEAGDR